MKILYALTILNTILIILSFKKKQRKKKYQLVFTTTINNNFTIKILKMQLEKQKWVDSILGLTDTKTGEAVTATFSNVVLTSSDPAIFTADTDVNADAQIDVVGVSEGEATLNVKADATYVNSLGTEVTTPEEANVPVTITAPAANETELTVTFSDPQPV